MKKNLITSAGLAALLANTAAVATFPALLPSSSGACAYGQVGEGVDYKLRRRLQMNLTVGM